METIYENNDIRIEKNSSGEIFLSLKNEILKCRLRISPQYDRILVTANLGTLYPWAVGSLPAFGCVAHGK